MAPPLGPRSIFVRDVRARLSLGGSLPVGERDLPGVAAHQPVLGASRCLRVLLGAERVLPGNDGSQAGPERCPRFVPSIGDGIATIRCPRRGNQEFVEGGRPAVGLVRRLSALCFREICVIQTHQTGTKTGGHAMKVAHPGVRASRAEAIAGSRDGDQASALGSDDIMCSGTVS